MFQNYPVCNIFVYNDNKIYYTILYNGSRYTDNSIGVYVCYLQSK